MFKQHFITSLFFVILLTACDNSSTNSTSSQANEAKAPTTPTKEAVDNSFNDFIEKFSTDSVFQLSRTKFPLKVKWYDLDNDRDSLIYRDRSSFEMMDFRKKESKSPDGQWKQEIFVDKNGKSATIYIRGVDNGIAIDYLFERMNGAWMLIEIDDSST